MIINSNINLKAKGKGAKRSSNWTARPEMARPVQAEQGQRFDGGFDSQKPRATTNNIAKRGDTSFTGVCVTVNAFLSVDKNALETPPCHIANRYSAL